MNVARIFAKQQWLKGPQNGGEAGSEEAFAEPSHAFVRFKADEGPIKVAFYDCSLQPKNLHATLDFLPGGLYAVVVLSRSTAD